MTVVARDYAAEANDHRVRGLLTATYALHPPVHNWHVARWDAFRFGRYGYQELSGERTWVRDVRLWEAPSGQLVGMVHPEAPTNIFLEVYPGYRHLEPDMLAWAEDHLAAARPAGARRWPLHTFVYRDDRERKVLLARRGYENLGPERVEFRFSLAGRVPEGTFPRGYRIRALRREDPEDVAAYAAAISRVFSVDFTPRAMQVLMSAQTRHEDLAVVAPDGTLASFCTIWLDETNRAGLFEPVGTLPVYRRRGLGRAMMWEGLRRLRAGGAGEAALGTGYRSPAVAFYRAVGFDLVDVIDHWRKWL